MAETGIRTTIRVLLGQGRYWTQTGSVPGPGSGLRPTLAVELDEPLLVLGQLGPARNLVYLPLQDGDFPVPPSLRMKTRTKNLHLKLTKLGQLSTNQITGLELTVKCLIDSSTTQLGN